jgi:mono/diheme cytochrome c family protein
LAGDGQGWDGDYLDPTPADFRSMAGKQMTPESQGEHMAKVTFGIKNTAMPYWGEFLPESDRWDALRYIMGSFMAGMPVVQSQFDANIIPAQFTTVTSDMYTSEGHTISASHGQEIYGTYCATCHGADGQGNGDGVQGSASQGPAAFQSDMSEGYVYWRMWDGISDSMMPPFQWLLTGSDIWDLTVYVRQMTGADGGGK